MTGSDRAHVNDLASPGSCLQLFNPIPFMFCEKQENCYYAQRNDRSYWLSTEEEPMMWNPVPANETQRHISRCAVCEAPSKVSYAQQHILLFLFCYNIILPLFCMLRFRFLFYLRNLFSVIHNTLKQTLENTS